MAPLNKGQRIADRYVLLSRLGGGTDSEVWLAQDRDGRSRVVIKFARLDDSADRARRLLANEFDVGRRFAHPSVVRYYDFHDDEALTYLTQEYLPDGSLQSWVKRPWRQFLPCVAELAGALAHVHSRGFVHRDVKLSNALLAEDGHVKLTDFGIASQAGEGGLRSGGSPLTASPQQRDGEPPSPTDDVSALGAMLHELVTGEAPSDGKRLAAADVPAALAARIAEMLDPDPARRPGDLAALAHEFEDMVDKDPNATLPPEEFDAPVAGRLAVEEIDPDNADLSATSDAPHAPPAAVARRGVPLAAGAMAILILLLGATAIFFVLPRMAPETLPVDVAGTNGGAEAAGQPAAPRAPEVEPWKLAQIARVRQQAEDRLEQLLEKQFLLEDRKIEVWGAEEYQAARDAAIAGDRAFRGEDFDAALAAYAEGDDILTELVARSEDLVGENLRLGASAIEEGNSAVARERFELVLKIEPDNGAAAKGLVRTETLDEVIALVEEGRTLEQIGQHREALALFEQARDLDGEWQAARDGIARMNGALVGARFNSAMSQGFAALSGNRFDDARAAFERARKLRPGAREIDEAIAQLEMRSRGVDVNNLRSEAEALEAAGDFDAARDKYRDALNLDDALGFARDGERRMTFRIDLEQRIGRLLADPDRLSNDSVYSDADALIDEARAVENPWPGLAGKIDELDQRMAQSRLTKVVRIISDNQTDVMVYRVGRLGRFEQTQLELRPGTYTVVGSRAGFRDVRQQFRIAPDLDAPVVEVRCEERI